MNTTRQTSGYNPGNDFLRDLARGKVGEGTWGRIIGGGTEVKTDYKASATGNIFVEYECMSRRDGEYHPSGICSAVMNPETDYWVIILPKTGAAIAVPKVQMLILTHHFKQLGYTRECSISGNPTRGVIIPVERLMRCLVEGVDNA